MSTADGILQTARLVKRTHGNLHRLKEARHALKLDSADDPATAWTKRAGLQDGHGDRIGQLLQDGPTRRGRERE